MLTRIIICVLAFSPVIGLCEAIDKDKEIFDRINDGGFEIQIIAEKHQSAKDGLVFTVALENKLEESISFMTTKKTLSLVTPSEIKENDIPFRYSVYFISEEGQRKLLSEGNDNNMLFMSNPPLFTRTRRIDIEGKSTISIGMVEFMKYRVAIRDDDNNDVGSEIKTITPGTYIIVASFGGSPIVDNYAEDDEWINFYIVSEEVEVVLE